MSYNQKLFYYIFFFFNIFIHVLSANEPSISNQHSSTCALFYPNQIKGKYLSTNLFDHYTNYLRKTLAGSYVTVWRSEWKVILPVSESNFFIKKMVEHFLTDQTSKKVLKDLNPEREEFTDELAFRLTALQKNNELFFDDQFKVRDLKNSMDIVESTFTYYTKPLIDESGIGKHQIRLRTYLRQIDLDKMEIEMPATAYTKEGNEVTITRLINGTYNVFTCSADGNEIQFDHLTKEETYQSYGNPLILFSQPGGKVKFEVKTVLKDMILSHVYPLLNGNNMIQKLDITIPYSILEKLFSSYKNKNNLHDQKEEAKKRIDDIEAELLKVNPKAEQRVYAVLSILKEGVNESPDFLKLEGATYYRRRAFEGGIGFQATIDKDQCAYTQDIYTDEGGLKDPAMIRRTSKKYLPNVKSERHIELKFPVSAVARYVGVQFYDQPDPNDLMIEQENDNSYCDAATIYHEYRTNTENPGKFHYLINQNYRKNNK